MVVAGPAFALVAAVEVLTGLSQGIAVVGEGALVDVDAFQRLVRTLLVAGLALAPESTGEVVVAVGCRLIAGVS